MKTFLKASSAVLLAAGLIASSSSFAAPAGVATGNANAVFNGQVAKCGINLVSPGSMIQENNTTLNAGVAGGAPAVMELFASASANATNPCVVIVDTPNASLSAFPSGYPVANATITVTGGTVTGMNNIAALGSVTAGSFSGSGFYLNVPTTNDQLSLLAKMVSTSNLLNGTYQVIIPVTVYR
jgi:hypothetical protein